MLTSAPDEESRFHMDFYSTDRCARRWNWSCPQPVRREWSPYCLFSRKLLPHERAYSTVEKECLAIVYILSVKHFQAYLLWHLFIIHTVHWALQWLQYFKQKNPRLTQWSLILQPFNFTVQHQKGQANANADTLSWLDSLGSLHFVQEKVKGECDRFPRTCYCLNRVPWTYLMWTVVVLKC